MPLHLLGKKSWNVYNADNIARVKRDEAEAAAREDAEEQRMQEVDAERRVKLLRGISTTPPHPQDVTQDEERRRSDKHDGFGRERKRRRLQGEDDTERDLRYAQEDISLKTERKSLQPLGKKSSDAPLMDQNGNINLFPVEAPKRHQHQKNAEAEAEKKRKERELEDQYTMRFSNAAGFKQSIGDKPWYQDMSRTDEEDEVGKDVWGNEDPRRKERRKERVQADDPLAMMKRGVQGVREVERERKKWVEEKEREIRELDEEQQRERRRRKREKEKRRQKYDEQTVDGSEVGNERHRHKDRHRHSHRHRHRDRHDR